MNVKVINVRVRRHLLGAALATVVLMAALAINVEAPARADVTAYPVNVTMRPGYNFANADAAVGYGLATCDKVAHGRSYGQVIDDAKADFQTADEFQASYLISQAVNELCPVQIWHLRTSAAHYLPKPS